VREGEKKREEEMKRKEQTGTNKKNLTPPKEKIKSSKLAKT